MSRALLFLALAGCTSAEQRLLDGWRGVYRVDGITQNDDGCDAEGDEVPIDPPWFELDAVAGIDAHLVELRACTSADACLNVGFATAITPKATETELDGLYDDWLFLDGITGIGTCQILHTEMEITRDGPEARALRVELRSTSAVDSSITSDDGCREFLEYVVDLTDSCDVLRVIEAHRAD